MIWAFSLTRTHSRSDTTSILPDMPRHRLGNSVGLGPFPVGILEAATHFFDREEFNLWMLTILCNVALKTEQCIPLCSIEIT